jgi:LacI family transcriptional regulator
LPVFGFDVDDVAIERLNSYVSWTKQRQSYDPALVVTSGDWVAPNGSDLLNDLLLVPNPPTALFCANDALALEMIAEANDRGLEVPRDLSVVGVDNSPQSRENGVALTTVDVHIEEVGKAALTALLRLMRDEGEERYRVSLPMSELIVRNTTAPAG